MRFDINPQSEKFSRAVYEELSRFDWSQPFQASAEELGVAMGCHLGLKRGRNEDRVAAGRVRAPSSEVFTVAVVCDGVGGSESGDQAASLAISAIFGSLCGQTTRRSLSDLVGILVKGADDLVRKELAGRGTTTLSILLASSSGHAVCASVGDSRVYAWAAGAHVIQISTDDTVENELKAIPGDHKELLNARGLKDRLSQAVGEADRTADELRIQIFPQALFSSGVILGSDGLWRVSKDFETVMLHSHSGIDAVRRGINLANWVGGGDNSSLIAVEDLGSFQNAALQSEKSDGVMLALWIGSSKFRFVEDPRPEWLKSSVAKSEKPKRKPAKPKKSEYTNKPTQLEISTEKNTSADSRPIIQISTDPEELK